MEEGVLENKRRPKTIVLHHRQGTQTRSRSAQIPQGKPLSEEILFDLAKNLLAQVVVDGRAWPCANLSLSVGGFEDGPKNNAGIGDFLVRGDQARAMFSSDKYSNGVGPPAKRRRTKGNIANFFGVRDDSKKDFDAARAVLMKAHSESTKYETEDSIEDRNDEDVLKNSCSHEAMRPTATMLDHHNSEEVMRGYDTPLAQPQSLSNSPPSYQYQGEDSPIASTPYNKPTTQAPIKQVPNLFFCPRCNIHLSRIEEAEHIDYHFALDLSKEMRHEERNPSPMSKGRGTLKPSKRKGKLSGRSSGRGGGLGGGERGQKTLAFGGQGSG